MIELWDDEVDSIRSFDAESQRSMENLDGDHVISSGRAIRQISRDTKGRVCWIISKQFRSLVFLDESNRLLERGETVEKEYRQSFENRMEKGQIAERSAGGDHCL